MFWMFILIIFVGIIILSIFAGVKQNAVKNSIVSAISTPTSDGFNPQRFFVGAAGKSAIAFDGESKRIRIMMPPRLPQDNFYSAYVSFKDIVGVEVEENGTTITKTGRGSQVAGAVVGGVLLGGVGAIIGGLSGRQTSSQEVGTLAVKIILQDMMMPLFIVDFISDNPGQIGVLKYKADSFMYKNAKNDADQCHAILCGILKMQGQDEVEPAKKIEKQKQIEKEQTPPTVIEHKASNFKNLYAILGISPQSSFQQIQNALRSACENQKISLGDAEICKKILLNDAVKVKYNNKLFKEYPNLKQSNNHENALENEGKSEQTASKIINSGTGGRGNSVIQPVQHIQQNKNAKSISLLIAFIVLGMILATCSLLKTEDKPAQTIEASTPDLSTPDSSTTDYSAYKAEADEIRANKENIPILFYEPNVTYTIIWHKVDSDGLIEIMSERVGSSGTSYTKKEIDCSSHSYRNLGTGDSIEEALLPRPDDKFTYSDGGSAGASIDAACSQYNINNNIEQPSDNTNQDENEDESINLEE